MTSFRCIAIPSTQNSILYSSLFKILLIPQGHPQMLSPSWEVFPDRSSQPSADDGVPSFLSKLSLQMPAISPVDTFCLCLLWLWALWEWKLLGASSVEAMCALHQNPLNKFLLEISSRKKIAPTDMFVYVLLSDSENLIWLSPFYLSYQEA